MATNPLGPARGDAAFERLTLLAVATALLWRLGRWALGFPLFGDEAFLARTFQHADVGELHSTLRHEMVVPYGFLLLTWVTARIAGFSELVLRFWPVLAGLTGFLLYVQLFRSRLQAGAALTAAALLAASYYPTRHAAELKPYAMDFLFSALLLKQALALSDTPDSTRRALAFGLTSVAAVLFSYPAAFVLGGAALTLARRAWRGGIRSSVNLLLAAGTGVVAFCVLYQLSATSQRWSVETIQAGQWAAHFPPKNPLEFPGWLLMELTGRMFAYPNGGASPGSLGTTLLVVVGVVTLKRRGRCTLACLCLAPLLPMLVASALYAYPFGGTARVHQHLAGPICLLAGVGLDSACRALPQTLGKRARIGIAGLLVLAPLGNLAKDVLEPYKDLSDARCREFVVDLASRTNPGESWMVFGGQEGPAREQFDWQTCGGSAARLAFYLDRDAPQPIQWGLDTSAPTPPTYVLVYRDNSVEHEGPRAEVLVEMVATWGEPTRSFYAFGKSRRAGGPEEGVTVYRFGS